MFAERTLKKKIYFGKSRNLTFSKVNIFHF